MEDSPPPFGTTSSLVRNLFCGAISLWYGSIAAIPKGYALCNGENGTPDLTDRFVKGAGGPFVPDETGGSILHNHTFTSLPHTHSAGVAGTDTHLFQVLGPNTGWAAATGTTDNGNVLPPYKSLAYIMEL